MTWPRKALNRHQAPRKSRVAKQVELRWRKRRPRGTAPRYSRLPEPTTRGIIVLECWKARSAAGLVIGDLPGTYRTTLPRFRGPAFTPTWASAAPVISFPGDGFKVANKCPIAAFCA